MAFSHNYLKEKNKLIKALLTQISLNADEIPDFGIPFDKTKNSSTMLFKKRLGYYFLFYCYIIIID